MNVEKQKYAKSAFTVSEFNQSVEVLPSLVSVNRADWPSLFQEDVR